MLQHIQLLHCVFVSAFLDYCRIIIIMTFCASTLVVYFANTVFLFFCKTSYHVHNIEFTIIHGIP